MIDTVPYHMIEGLSLSIPAGTMYDWPFGYACVEQGIGGAVHLKISISIKVAF